MAVRGMLVGFTKAKGSYGLLGFINVYTIIDYVKVFKKIS